MSLQEYYEESYHREQCRDIRELADEAMTFSKGLFNFVVESKNRFLPDRDWSDLSVLETGGGRGGVGLLLSKLGARVMLVDFSTTAIEQAKKVFSLEGEDLSSIVGDVTLPDLELPQKYDLIVDSHLLHCLTEDPDRSSYYRLVSDHLTENGIFIAETMVHRKKLYIPDSFMFDERHTLWQMFGKWVPIRKILDSLDLEKELQEARFNIIYFYYYGQYGFVPHRNFLDLPSEILPAAVRLVVQNKPL